MSGPTRWVRASELPGHRMPSAAELLACHKPDVEVEAERVHNDCTALKALISKCWDFLTPAERQNLWETYMGRTYVGSAKK